MRPARKQLESSHPPFVGEDNCNLCGYPCPLPHAGYAKYAAELLFHSSRYRWVAERFLRHLSGEYGFSLAGYRPTRLSDKQRVEMSRLLAEAPDRESALGIMNIVSQARS